MNNSLKKTVAAVMVIGSGLSSAGCSGPRPRTLTLMECQSRHSIEGLDFGLETVDTKQELLRDLRYNDQFWHTRGVTFAYVVAQNSKECDVVLHPMESYLVNRLGQEWSYIPPEEVKVLGMPTTTPEGRLTFVIVGALFGPSFYLGSAIGEAMRKDSLVKSSEKMLGEDLRVAPGTSAGGFIPFKGPVFSHPGELQGARIYVPYSVESVRDNAIFEVGPPRDYAQFSEGK